jgi:hypothetical protein
MKEALVLFSCLGIWGKEREGMKGKSPKTDF